MLISTTENIGKKYKVIGVVRGNTIRARNVGRDLMAGLKQIIGGEIKSYTQMLTKARDEAESRMIDEAKKLGADAVVMVRYASSDVMQAASEVLAYGTAVKFSK